MRRNALFEAVGMVGIVVSLVFVGYEIRQNTVASRAAAYQTIGIASAARQASYAEDPDLARLATDDPEKLAKMSNLDWERIVRDELAWHRLGETVFLQVEAGLLPSDALARLGYAQGFNGLRSACVWPVVREFMGDGYRAYMEQAVRWEHDCERLWQTAEQIPDALRWTPSVP